MEPENVRFDDKSAARVASIVVVTIVHLVAFVFISLPATPLRRIRAGKVPVAGNDLTVRLLEVHVPTASAHVKRSAGRKPVPRRITRHRKHAAARVVPDTEAHRDGQKATRPLDLSLPDTSDVEPMVGRTLGHVRSEPHFRLPGGGHVHGAPRIELIDPRMQGVAGAVRMIQGVFGGADPHCVAVDNWRGMTREERFEQHVTQADIRHTADEYGCIAPKRHQAMPGDPEPPWVFPGH